MKPPRVGFEMGQTCAYISNMLNGLRQICCSQPGTQAKGLARLKSGGGSIYCGGQSRFAPTAVLQYHRSAGGSGGLGMLEGNRKCGGGENIPDSPTLQQLKVHLQVGVNYEVKTPGMIRNPLRVCISALGFSKSKVTPPGFPRLNPVNINRPRALRDLH